MLIKYSKKVAATGRVLDERLKDYSGILVWGYKNNKHESLKKFKDYGLPIANLIKDYPGYTVLGRPSYHQAGRKMFICNSQEEMTEAKQNGATHFMRFLNIQKEFRVHCINGEVIKISEKIPPGNHVNGSIFKNTNFELKETLKRLAIQAVECLGYDIGAVDIIYNQDGFFVLEVNTAPCLTDPSSNTIDKYIEAITKDRAMKHNFLGLSW